MPDCPLAPLASQHHLSLYNRLRYGHNGCPAKYYPLSTAFPAQYHHLQLRQQASAECQTAWYLSRASPRDCLSDELQAAMDEPLTPQSPSGRVKTSMTHPINISCLLPTEAISLISSHAVLAAPSSPVLLEIPHSFLAQNLARPGSLVSEPLPPLPQPSLILPPVRSELTAALEAAISASLPANGLASSDASLSSAISLSLSIEIPGGVSAVLLSHPPEKIALQRLGSVNAFSVGNLYMSSCPGKKVRLNGPVSGRSAVCRDLDMDLARMRSLGIRCIICCLDDEELELLGAPWPEYEKSAQSLGMDVLRLPIPEGLPPITTAYLDIHLGRVVQEYTLKGMSVLVHCRGGVGRAGVVACCWLIKLGICGWVSERDCASENDAGHPNTIEYVNTVITFVRQRRNYKAVETLEQVQFLVDYVNFLYNKHLQL